MNTFKRLSDIISANLNSALDKAENPEKMLDLSIRKLEETRAKIRAEIADRNTEKDTYAKHMSEKRAEAARWETRAELSISKGRDDMAREAIAGKLEAEKEAKKDEETITTLSSLVAALQETLARTEEKLEEMKAKSAELKARYRSTETRLRAHETIRKSDNLRWREKLEEISTRIERWEAEADLTAPAAKRSPSFEEMELDETIENELKRLREAANV